MRMLTDAEYTTLTNAAALGEAFTAQGADDVLEKARALVSRATFLGLVLTIEQRPLQPLAMGNYETTVAVRAARSKT